MCEGGEEIEKELLIDDTGSKRRSSFYTTLSELDGPPVSKVD